MFDFNTLFEFSRTHCIAICAFLVPANLLATLLTLILTGLGRPQVQLSGAAGLAIIPAIAIIFHVFTWFAVGVVMAPTYILLFLGGLCLSINFWAIAHSASLMRLLRILYASASELLGRLYQNRVRAWEIKQAHSFSFSAKSSAKAKATYLFLLTV